MPDSINHQSPLSFSQNVSDTSPKIIWSVPQENVSQADKEAFDAQMEALLALLAKSPLTESDSLQLQNILITLAGMTKDGGMNQAVKDIVTILDGAYTAITGKTGFSDHFYFPPASLEVALSLKAGDTKTISDLIKSVATAAIKDPNATKSVGDLALAMVQEAFKTYENRLKELQDQIDISKTVISSLTELQKILNMIDVDSPANFNWNPTSWDQVPPALKTILKDKYGITDIKGINNNFQKWINAATDYFCAEIGWTANPGDIATTFNQAITARDSLIAQLAQLEKLGADKTDTAGAYYTVDKLVKDIEKYLPTSKYPVGSQANEMGSVVGPDGKTIPNVDIKSDLVNFIKAGQVKNGGISQDLDSALSANQTLSSKMADEMKALNTWFQQLMDVLTAIEDAYNKGTVSYARNIRG